MGRLGSSCEKISKITLDFRIRRDKLRKELAEHFSLGITRETERQSWSEKRVLPAGLMWMSLVRYLGLNL